MLKSTRHVLIRYILCTGVLGLALLSCSQPTPERTVQRYLQALSGEREITQATLEEITTERYRSTEHPHLASIASESREEAIDIATEWKDDPAITELMRRVTWETTYETLSQTESAAEVVARVIMTERRRGDREAALSIPNLPPPLVTVLERGLELPFRFELVRENNRWKIDSFTIPDVLLPMLDLSSLAEDGQDLTEAPSNSD